MRPLLSFDTSGAHCAAAILWPSEARSLTVCEDMAKGQAERLLPMIQEMMADAGLTLADFAAIGVGVGPGNFTGIRISVALARGLALGLGIPAIGVSGFDARAYGVDLRDFYAVIPAPRGQVYAQRFGGVGAAQLLDAAPTDAPALSITDLSGGQLALAVAHIASQRLGGDTPRPAPFYLRPADAAPPSDPPPIIFADV
ncbi:MAG: tRNA (adenosine(37)-N6)-threonylcarbamoyltransferase complex dimerization subunit type 1 TsaB [Cypionkella sp.]|nr:tRNA (adenosine(37)-N6)-threonylcarbamoyltransferase complex dimerization subunit type 1 TsaB [Cypionkella sp.]